MAISRSSVRLEIASEWAVCCRVRSLGSSGSAEREVSRCMFGRVGRQLLTRALPNTCFPPTGVDELHGGSRWQPRPETVSVTLKTYGFCPLKSKPISMLVCRQLRIKTTPLGSSAITLSAYALAGTGRFTPFVATNYPGPARTRAGWQLCAGLFQELGACT